MSIKSHKRAATRRPHYKSVAYYMQIPWPYSLLAVMADTLRFASTKVPTATMAIFIVIQATMNTLSMLVGARRAKRIEESRKKIRLLLDAEAREDNLEILELEQQVNRLRGQQTTSEDESRNGSIELSRKKDFELETFRTRASDEKDELLTRIQAARKQLEAATSNHRTSEIAFKVRIAELENQLTQAKELRDLDARRSKELEATHADHLEKSHKVRQQSLDLQDRVDTISKELHSARTEHTTEANSLSQRALELQQRVDELVEELKIAHSDHQTHRDISSSRTAELQTRIQELELLVEEARGHAQQRAGDLQVTQGRVTEAENRIRDLEQQLKVKGEDAELLKKQLADAEGEKSRLVHLLESATAEVHSLYQRIEEFKVEGTGFEKRLAQADEEKQSLHGIVKGKDGELIELQTRLTKTEGDKLASETKSNELLAEQKKLEERLTAAEQQRTILETQLKAKDEEISSLIKAQATSPLPARMSARSISASSAPTTPSHQPSSLGRTAIRRSTVEKDEKSSITGSPRITTRQRLGSFLGLP